MRRCEKIGKRPLFLLNFEAPLAIAEVRMLLYKYCSPRRIDILKNLTIAASYADNFNDPFELNPNITAFLDKGKLEMAKEKSFRETLKNMYAEKSHAYKSQNSFQDYMRKQPKAEIFAGLDIHHRKEEPELIQDARDHLVDTTVMISLSETERDLTMWSHYAQDHEGFVVGFDSDTLRFLEPKNISIHKSILEKVRYSVERPAIISSDIHKRFEEFYLTKSRHWEYEQEWRFVFHIGDVRANKSDKYLLFEFGPEAIESVYLGTRMRFQAKKYLRHISQRPELSHIKMFETNLHDTEYNLTFDPLN